MSTHIATLVMVAALHSFPTTTNEFAAARLLVVSRNTNTVLDLPLLPAQGSAYRILGLGTDAPGAWDCAFGPDGRLWVASLDDDRVVGFDGAFFATSPVGTGTTLDGADGICFGPAGNLFVASTFNDRVLEFDPDGALVQTYSYDVTNAPIDGPTGVAISTEGRLLTGAYWSDSIVSFDLDGYPAAIATGTFARPELITPFIHGGVFVASSTTNQTLFHAEPSQSGPDANYVVGPVSNPKRILFAPNGLDLVSSFANDKIESSPAGGFAPPELDGPIGMAIVPYRFTARVKGTLHTGTLGDLKIDETAVLSILPRSTTAFLRFPESPFPNALANWIGSRDLVFQGLEGRRTNGKGSTWRGTQLPRNLANAARASIALGLSFKTTKKGEFLGVKSASGSLTLATSSAVFEGSVKTKKAIN